MDIQYTEIVITDATSVRKEVESAIKLLQTKTGIILRSKSDLRMLVVVAEKIKSKFLGRLDQVNAIGAVPKTEVATSDPKVQADDLTAVMTIRLTPQKPNEALRNAMIEPESLSKGLVYTVVRKTHVNKVVSSIATDIQTNGGIVLKGMGDDLNRTVGLFLQLKHRLPKLDMASETGTDPVGSLPMITLTLSLPEPYPGYQPPPPKQDIYNVANAGETHGERHRRYARGGRWQGGHRGGYPNSEGLGTSAIAKRAEAEGDSSFKKPRDRVEEEDGTDFTNKPTFPKTSITDQDKSHGSQYRTKEYDQSSAASSESSRPSTQYDDSRGSNRDKRRRYDDSTEDRNYRERSHRHDDGHGRKRSRYDGHRTPGRSQNDGRQEWEDTPCRSSRSSSRRHVPSPPPMHVGASSDARLVSPGMGEQTPIGLDTLAIAKRAEAEGDPSLKKPRERVASAVASPVKEEDGTDFTNKPASPTKRYRLSGSESSITDKDKSYGSQYRTKEYDQLSKAYDGHGRKRRGSDGHRTPGKSQGNDGRKEWEDTLRRSSHSSSRRHVPSPSPMHVGASPDARLVSPWMGGQTPTRASPSHIRASESSVRSSNSRYGRKSNLPPSTKDSFGFWPLEDGLGQTSQSSEAPDQEISESKRGEISEYRYDGDASGFLGDEASFQKQEAEAEKNQQQPVCMAGLKLGSTAYLRPKRLGL